MVLIPFYTYPIANYTLSLTPLPSSWMLSGEGVASNSPGGYSWRYCCSSLPSCCWYLNYAVWTSLHCPESGSCCWLDAGFASWLSRWFQDSYWVLTDPAASWSSASLSGDSFSSSLYSVSPSFIICLQPSWAVWRSPASSHPCQPPSLPHSYWFSWFCWLSSRLTSSLSWPSRSSCAKASSPSAQGSHSPLLT